MEAQLSLPMVLYMVCIAMVMVIAMAMVMVIAMVMAMVMACTWNEVADSLIAVSSARVLLSKGLFGSHRFCLYSC